MIPFGNGNLGRREREGRFERKVNPEGRKAGHGKGRRWVTRERERERERENRDGGGDGALEADWQGL